MYNSDFSILLDTQLDRKNSNLSLTTSMSRKISQANTATYSNATHEPPTIAK